MSFCTIQLDNAHRQYYPGTEIKGTVVCVFEEAKHIREIRVKLKGNEHNSWINTRYGKKRNPRQYRADHNFLVLKNTIREEGHLSPGRYEYHFTFTLPKDTPGSYRSTYGWIKYSVKATVDRAIGHNYKDDKELSVISLVDLNTMADDINLAPTAYSEDKILRCCCCSQGSINMFVYLEKEVYVVGEPVIVKVVITNMSEENIERLNVKITKTTESLVTTPGIERKYDYELLASASDSGVGAHGERNYNFVLEIPKSTLLHNFSLCALFKQWTMLKIKAVLPGFHMSMKVSARLVLGHIPVGGQLQNFILQQGTFLFVPQENNSFTTEEWDPYRPAYSLSNNAAVHQISYPVNATLYSTSDPSSSSMINFAAPQPALQSLLPVVHKPSTSSRLDEAREGNYDASAPRDSSAPPTYNEAAALPPFLPK